MSRNKITLVPDYIVVPVTIGQTAASIGSLVTASGLLPSGTTVQDVCQFSILENSAPILFGGATSQPATLTGATERTWPVRGCNVWMKRSGATDVTALVECFINKSQD